MSETLTTGLGDALTSAGAAVALLISAGVAGAPPNDGELRALLEALPAAIYTTDAAGRITYYNEAAALLAGRRPVLGEDLWCVTWRLYEPDGTPLPHECCPMAVTLRENRAVRGVEAIAERPDGSRVPILPFPTPLRDDAGHLIGAVNLLVDISDRKRAESALRDSEDRYRRLSEQLEELVAQRTRELSEANARLRVEAAERERAEAALRQAQKMEAVGQLASGIAHDFNNLLTAVLGNLELIDSRVSDPGLRKLVQAALRSVLRGAQLSGQMLAFSRKQHLAPQDVDLNGLIGGMSDLLQRTLAGTVRVETSLAPDLWPALVDPTQIEMVVLNLAINARDALPHGGTVRITTRNVVIAEKTHRDGLAPGEYVCLEVADDGVGMPDIVRERACEPFFTTKQPGKGSGLGLSQVYGMAQQSGGDIEIRSALGKGTVVAVYLPRSARQAERGVTSEASAERPRRHGGASILVVDDQPEVREVASAHLEMLGCRVVQAADGDTALALIERHGGFDLLIADYAMAEMNGVELLSAARRRCPAMPAVLTTGYADLGEAELQFPDVTLLRKPYRLHDLAAIVERALQA